MKCGSEYPLPSAWTSTRSPPTLRASDASVSMLVTTLTLAWAEGPTNSPPAIAAAMTKRRMRLSSVLMRAVRAHRELQLDQPDAEVLHRALHGLVVEVPLARHPD